MLDPHDLPPTSPAPTPQMLLAAYSQGLFPMARSRTSRGVDWYCPNPRAVVPLDNIRVSRSLRQRIRRGELRLTRDAAFDRVIRACSLPRVDDGDTWINRDIIDAYEALHQLGHAHSVEAWLGDKLVGGLYGIAIGGAFFGESMFSRPDRGGTDASKVAFVHLAEHLRARGYMLLDSQINSPHMQSLGAIDIHRDQYLKMLDMAIRMDVRWEAVDDEAGNIKSN